MICSGHVREIGHILHRLNADLKYIFDAPEYCQQDAGFSNEAWRWFSSPVNWNSCHLWSHHKHAVINISHARLVFALKTQLIGTKVTLYAATIGERKTVEFLRKIFSTHPHYQEHLLKLHDWWRNGGRILFYIVSTFIHAYIVMLHMHFTSFFLEIGTTWIKQLWKEKQSSSSASLFTLRDIISWIAWSKDSSSWMTAD